MTVVASGGSLVATANPWSAPFRPHISNSVELFSGRAADYATLYRVQPNLRLVIRFLARNIGQLGLKAYRRVAADERLDLEPTHPLAEFLRSPVSIAPTPMSRHVWVRGIVEDLALYDALYGIKVRNPDDGKLSVVRMPPTKIRPVGESYLWPDGFERADQFGKVTYDVDDVLYMHGHNPSDPRTGLSSVEALRQLLAEEAAAGDWREQYWRGAARMPGVIKRPLDAPKWSEAAARRWREDFQSAYAGNGGRAGQTPVLEEGMEFDATSFSAKDSEYLGARRLSREETAATYFIPPVFVGLLENANFANIREQHVSLYADTLGPWLDWITSDLELQLLREFPDTDDVYLEFNIAAKLEGSFEEQAAATSTAVGAPWLTRNEARALRNLPPIDEADALVVPLNVLTGGQASPRDSAPIPTPELAAAGRSIEHTKAIEARAKVAHYLDGWERKTAEVLDAFVARQRATVLTRLGAGVDVEAALDRARWDAELAADLAAVSLALAAEVGGKVAADFGEHLDLGPAEDGLIADAERAARAVNDATAAALAVDPREGAAVFDGLAARTGIMATTRVTQVGQWARLYAAIQVGAGSKTWRSSGLAASRHRALDGETVALDGTFSNGAAYPGDPALGMDQTAGCQCELTFGGSPP